MTTLKPKGFLRRTLDAFVKSREREADRHISRALLKYDDATLRAGGYDRPDLQRRTLQY